jgi:hypothetical protein
MKKFLVLTLAVLLLIITLTSCIPKENGWEFDPDQLITKLRLEILEKAEVEDVEWSSSNNSVAAENYREIEGYVVFTLGALGYVVDENGLGIMVRFVNTSVADSFSFEVGNKIKAKGSPWYTTIRHSSEDVDGYRELNITVRNDNENHSFEIIEENALENIPWIAAIAIENIPEDLLKQENYGRLVQFEGKYLGYPNPRNNYHGIDLTGNNIADIAIFDPKGESFENTLEEGNSYVIKGILAYRNVAEIQNMQLDVGSAAFIIAK